MKLLIALQVEELRSRFCHLTSHREATGWWRAARPSPRTPPGIYPNRRSSCWSASTKRRSARALPRPPEKQPRWRPYCLQFKREIVSFLNRGSIFTIRLNRCVSTSSSATSTSCQPVLSVSSHGKSSQGNGNQEYAGWFRDRINRYCRVVTKEVLSIRSS